MNKKVLILHGPNLNLLGSREPGIYGTEDFQAIKCQLEKMGSDNGINVVNLQSNSESVLIDEVHQAPKEGIGFILLNPAAFTHTSIALRDAMVGVGIPFLEIHISNIYRREDFRKNSYFSDIAIGTICGLGTYGYYSALRFAVQYLEEG